MRDEINEIKMNSKCMVCDFQPESPSQMVYDHIDPATKYVTKTNRRLGVSALVVRGYNQQVILAEMAKCRLLCANCHAHFTNEVQQPNKKEKK